MTITLVDAEMSYPWATGGARGTRPAPSVVGPITLELDNGVVGLVGRNGAGKTTLLGMLAGQLKPSAGTVRSGGRDAFDDPVVLSDTSFTGVDVLYPPQWSVATVLSVAGARYPYWDQGMADDLTGRFGLRRFARMSALSTGQRSIVGIVVGLASRAPLTPLDEPYSGLDVQNRRVFYEVLADARENDPRCIVLSTHQLADAGRVVDRLLVLGAQGSLSHDIDGAELGERVVRLTGSTARMTAVLDEVRNLPGVRPTAMRDVAGSMSVDVDLDGGVLPDWPGVTRERLGTEDAVLALTGEPEP